MKKVKKNSFNVGEDEAELFLSLKNAFSSLAIAEDDKKRDSGAEDTSSVSNYLGLSDHEKLAQEINPDELASRVGNAFQKWEKIHTPNSEVLALSATSEQAFAEIETEMLCVTEAIEYMVNVLGSSKKTVESLGKITDEYVKGWALVESVPEVRYRYCLMTDQLGAKWLDALLEFSALSVEKRTEWLNRFMQNWSYVNGTERVAGTDSFSNDDEDDYQYAVGVAESKEVSLKIEGDKESHNIADSKESPKIEEGKEPNNITDFPLNNENGDKGSSSLKRGRSNDMDDGMNDYTYPAVSVDDEKELHKRLRWEFVKNMQLMGSMRFELCKKCGMREDCLKIAQQMNDREKIVESRLMSGDAGDDELNEAMNSLLHL